MSSQNQLPISSKKSLEAFSDTHVREGKMRYVGFVYNSIKIQQRNASRFTNFIFNKDVFASLPTPLRHSETTQEDEQTDLTGKLSERVVALSETNGVAFFTKTMP
jgi:hypothetical protein